MNKQTLQEYNKDLTNAPINLRDRIAKECDVTMPAVYRWLKGWSIPDKLKREKIAEIIGKPVEELFPNIEKVKN